MGSTTEERAGTATPSGGSTLKGLKVLVIDDSKTIRRTAETLLVKEGCEVFTAVDGFDALAKIADHQPDIVFVDIMMPRLDGYQTCALIKHNKVFRAIPVIMLSSKDGLFDRADHIERRFGKAVVFALDDTLEALHRVLDLHLDAGRAGEDGGDVERLWADTGSAGSCLHKRDRTAFCEPDDRTRGSERGNIYGNISGGADCQRGPAAGR